MMYAEGDEFIRDFVMRTKSNYERFESGPYEITQLINSAIGLLIVPQQTQYDKIVDCMVSATLLEQLLNSVKTNTYTKKLDLPQIARHLRNSISHAKFEFRAEKCSLSNEPLQIHSVLFTDKNTKTGELLEMELTVDLIKDFFYAFSDAASNVQ